MRILSNVHHPFCSFITTCIPFISLICKTTRASAPAGPWDAFNFAPSSRTVRPVSIFRTEGHVQNAEGLLSPDGRATLLGNGAYVALDFGKEIGGLVSLNIHPSSKSSAFSLSFTESSMFVSPLTSDDSSTQSANMSYDGVLSVPAPIPSGLWTTPRSRLRGGFRFLTLVSNADAPITLSNVSVAISFSPSSPDLRDYSGYFYAKDPNQGDDDLLTKIWYAGAYTVQTNVLAADEGRVPDVPYPGWANDATIGISSPVLVDGAKRDRNVWAGDMGISLPTQFVSTGDLVPSKNSIATVFSIMDPITSAIPYCGPPLCTTASLVGTLSDTYHMWTLIGTYSYVLYTGDLDYLKDVWANYTKAVEFLENKVQPNGLFNVSNTADWARVDRGGEDSEGNAIYYRVLTNSVELALLMNDTSLAEGWSANATTLKRVFNEVFWSDELGMYTDNATTTLTPQDANSLAVLFNVTNTPDQASAISEGLTKNWNEFGALAPEVPDTIAPFIGGFEVQAHFIAGEGERALDLLRREWGYMLTTNLSVQSTLLEGYTANGSLYYRSALGYSYDASYTSHAHGWSTGPTSALTFYLVGLQITSLQGRTWMLAPCLSGLDAAEGGFGTGLGWFGASWAREGEGEGVVRISVETPEGTEGVLKLPQVGFISSDGEESTKESMVVVDGVGVGVEDEDEVGGGGFVQLSGGNHTIVIS